MRKSTDQDDVMNAESATTHLTTQQSLDFLVGQSFGRLAVTLHGQPDIFPINFAVHPTDDDHAVAYIRTSHGKKLFTAAAGFPVALEADHVEDATATSVVAYGRGRLVQHRHEFELVETLGLTAWVAERKPEIVAIDLERVSGRQFLLGPAPESSFSEPPD